MNTTKLLIMLFAFSIQAAFAQENSVNGNTQIVKGTSLKLPNIQVIPIKDIKNERQYDLYIKLPERYSENKDAKYPVIYFTDAMWHVEILSASTEYMLEDVILVGISWQKDINEDLKKEVGMHVSRFRDYSISKHSKPEIQAKYQLGQANNHLDFIQNEVIKYIDKTYRTDQHSRTYFGYSLGGEFGAYVLLTQPNTFDNYIIGSPSIKNEIPYLSELNAKFGSFEASKRNTSLNANVFISYGTLEKEMAKPIGEFIDLLKGRRDDGLFLRKEVIDGTHQTAFPMTGVRSVAWLSNILNPVSSDTTEPSFSGIPQLNQAFINPTPEDQKDGIEVGELGIDGGNKEMILKLAKRIANNEFGVYDSYLIAHKDKLLLESYYKRGRMNLAHPQASATKTYTGLLLGRAIQLGYLTMADLDKPLVSFLKDLDSTKFVKGVEKITLNHALTSRTGIRISKKKEEEMKKNQSQLKGQMQVQAMLESSSPISKESQSFKYGDGPELVMQVIDAVVPGTAKDFIKNEFFGKLGITNYSWQTAPSGLPESGWLTSISSRDMIKLGILAMNKGKWKEEQLIPKAFITKAISRIHLTGDDVDIFGGGKDVLNQGYGYFWWSADLKVGDRSYFCASAQGGGPQYIMLIEELDLVVVFTGHNNNDNNALQIMAEKIIPAFID